MKKLKLLCSILFSGITSFVLSQPTHVWQSNQTGTWSTSSIWDVSGSASGAPPATLNSDYRVTIASGDTVTLSSAQLQVKPGADLFVYGYLIVDHVDGLEFFNGSTVTIYSGGTLQCTSGEVRNNAVGTQVNGTLLCTGDFSAGNGSSISGTGTMNVEGDLTISGTATVMGNGDNCTSCELTTAGYTYVFYVATTGDNSNTGKSSSDPFLTIAKAITEISSQADDGRIEIADGTYDESAADLTVAYSTYFEGTSKAGTIINNINNMTIDASQTLTISNASVTSTGTTDVNGTLLMDGAGLYDADGTFDATGGNLTFSGDGELSCANTVTSLGTFTPSTGTVTYDGGAQNVLTETYNHLSISAAGTKTATGNLDVNGNLTTAATASCVLDLSSHDLNVAGNITIGATDGLDLSDASCLLTIDGGAGDQTITHAGNTGSELSAVTLNKAAGNAVLASAVELDGSLTLTSGDIDASANNLTLTSVATSSAGSDASHIIGTMVKTTAATSDFTFPLGDGSQYKAITITPSSGSSTVWTAEYFLQANTPIATTLDGSAAGDLDHVSTYEYWDLDRSGSANAKIAIPWVAANAVLAPADLRLAHFDGDWDLIEATPVGVEASGVITSSGAEEYVSTFSPFTLGSSSSTNVLPIELVSFSGEKKDNKNILNWTTASEINNAFFTIEKSYNGIDFEWVGRQEGTSPSIQIVNYSFTDYNILKTINYYRLKQTDFDGKSEYSSTISIDNRIDYSFKEIIGRRNLLGQEVDEFYNGIVIVNYKDGTSEKFYQFK